MMSLNQRVAALIGLLLSSCTNHPSPIIPTIEANLTPTINVSPTTATLESLPISTNTPHATDNTPMNTMTPGQEPAVTPAATLNVSPQNTPMSDSNSPLIIPDTGQAQETNNNDKPDKFHDFTVPVSGETGFFLVPSTGFAKGVQSVIKPQPAELKYSAMNITLEIPSLGVDIPVVGVPKHNQTWDVSWLKNQAGWLEGSAFPSWNGNSVLAGHVYLANGLPGPFVYLEMLKQGDKIIVHVDGQKHLFEIKNNTVVEPNDQSVMKHEDERWLTLVTCKDYDIETKTYKKRVIVRAVWVKAEWE